MYFLNIVYRLETVSIVPPPYKLDGYAVDFEPLGMTSILCIDYSLPTISEFFDGDLFFFKELNAESIKRDNPEGFSPSCSSFQSSSSLHTPPLFPTLA
jgi:hypothetical protein